MDVLEDGECDDSLDKSKDWAHCLGWEWPTYRPSSTVDFVPLPFPHCPLSLPCSCSLPGPRRCFLDSSVLWSLELYLVTSLWADGTATGSLAVWANVYVPGLSSVHVAQKSSCSFCSGLDSFLLTMKLLCHPVFTCSQVSLTDRVSVLLSGASQKIIQDHVIAQCSCPGVVAPRSLGVQSGRKRAVHLPPSLSSVERLFF